MTPTPPPRGPSCPPTVTLEAFAAGEPQPIEAHVAGCATCAAYVQALRVEAAAFSRARPPELFLRQLERRAAAPPWWRRWLVLAPVAAAALAVLLVVRTRPEDDGVTLKGAPLHVFIKRGDVEPRPLAADARVQPGDALRFSYDAPSPGFLAVFDLDGREAVTVFWPYGASAAGAVERGQGLLPGSVVLDASPGPEWLVAVWSPTPFDTASLAAQLKGQSTRPSVSLDCKGCVVTTQRLLKP